MKKAWNRVLAIGLVGVLCGSFAACTPTPNSSESSSSSDIYEGVDTSKLQLNVSNWDGGYGSAWLGEVKARYEALHANDVFADGKKGVQIMIHPIKADATALAGAVVDGIDHVYFTEDAYYYDLLRQDIFEPITEAVTGDLSGYGDAQGMTIESKLTEQQKEYYKVNGEYYGIPHYAGYVGMTYNRRMFDTFGYYFAASPVGSSVEGKFISEDNPVKSSGPNGIAGDYDDGLPATYEEFFTLCDWIDDANQTAVMLNGSHYKGYAQFLTEALTIDYEGLEQMMLNYTFDGTATDLATINENGEVVLDAEDTQITVDNGYELARQAGKAYALQFMEKLLTHDDYKYMNEDFDSPSLTHMNAQEKYLVSMAEGSKTAMLIEGIWWQSEATQAFLDAEDEFGEEYGKLGSDFAWMPFPKATDDKVGDGVTLYDRLYSLCFMKKGVSGEIKDVALDFIKFCYTQESLVEFTQITGTPKAVTYDLTEDDLKGVSGFGRSILDIKNLASTKVVTPYATSKFYQANQPSLVRLFVSNVGDVTVENEAEIFVTSDYDAKAYFDGIYSYRVSEWGNWKNAAEFA